MSVPTDSAPPVVSMAGLPTRTVSLVTHIYLPAAYVSNDPLSINPSTNKCYDPSFDIPAVPANFSLASVSSETTGVPSNVI